MKQNSRILLLPLLLVLISIPIEQWSNETSRIMKFTAMVLVAGNMLYKRQKNIFVFSIPVVLGYLVFLTLYNNVKLQPAVEDGLRYVIPIIALVYGMQLKMQRNLVLIVLLSYVLLSDIFQLVYGILSLILANDTIFNRASGFVGFFDFFGFINLVALVITKNTDLFSFNKYKKYIEVILVLFIIWSLSLKIIFLLLIYLLIKNRNLIFLPLVTVVVLVLTGNKGIIDGFLLRINRYFINQESARNESYRVVFENLNEFWLIGKGPGTFGGPASTKYNSILYNDYNFNWYGEFGLATTDTYYPHLIVEMGLVFAFLYILIALVTPLLISKLDTSVVLLIFFISVNSIFSFALNSVNYCFFSLVVVGLQIKSAVPMSINYLD